MKRKGKNSNCFWRLTEIGGVLKLRHVLDNLHFVCKLTYFSKNLVCWLYKFHYYIDITTWWAPQSQKYWWSASFWYFAFDVLKAFLVFLFLIRFKLIFNLATKIELCNGLFPFFASLISRDRKLFHRCWFVFHVAIEERLCLFFFVFIHAEK